jgi:hypothetical protein
VICPGSTNHILQHDGSLFYHLHFPAILTTN